MKTPNIVSKRVKIILSSIEDSKKLTQAIRNYRKGKCSTFTLTKQTQQRLSELK